MVAAGFGAVALASLFVVEGARINRRSQQKGSSSCGAKGASAPSSQIVNGQPATECEWRWQAQLRNGDHSFCGGMLIDPEWVLTAAHCVRSPEFDVVVGDHNNTFASANRQTRKAWKVYPHPGYDARTTSNDFAMVRLDSPVTIDECVGTVCLPSPGADVQPNTKCWITGWGTLSSGGAAPQILQEAEVAIVSNEDCVTEFGYDRSQIDETMLCAQGRTADGKVTDACQGDSGGPLVCESSSGQWTVYGATSWGNGCAGENYPGIWARVHQEVDWIQAHLDGDEPNPPLLGCPSPNSFGPNSAGDCVCRWGLHCHKDDVMGACPNSQGTSSRSFLPTCDTCVCRSTR